MTQPLILTRAEANPDSLDESRRYQEFIASTTTLDAHGSIVKQDWDLTRYAKNPIVLRDHDSGRPIGTAEARVENGALVAGVTFATGDDDADRAWNLVKQRVLRAMSVGFRPGECEILEIEDDFVVVYGAPKLFELSVVGVPSNEDCLARAYGASAEAETEIRRALSEKRAAASNTKGPAMAEATKTAPVAEAAAVAPVASAPATVNKEAMDIVVKTLRDQITERDASIVALKAKVEAGEAALAETRKASVETKVRGFVGSKLTEATLPKFLDLAKKSEEAFDLAIDALPDLGIAPGKQVVPEAKADSRAAATDEDAAIGFINQRTTERMKETGEDRQSAMRTAMREAQARGLVA